jgi:hypothetical protein
MAESRTNLLVAAVILVLGVVLTIAGMTYFGKTATPAVTNLDEVADLADAANASPAMQGAPMDAPVQGAPMDSPAVNETATGDAPADSAGVLENGKPSLISQESVNLLSQVDPGGEGADLFNFEKTRDGLYHKVSFKALGGFKYEVPDPEVVRAQPDPSKPPADQIPPALREIDGAPVLLAGFMVPIDLDADGNVRSFALTQDQMFCCYGVPPKMNEWVMVNMAEGHSTEWKNNLPVAVYGTLEIGEEMEDGYVLSLYRLKSDKVVDVRELVEQKQS